jgi:enterochelin esterase-like enzyme
MRLYILLTIVGLAMATGCAQSVSVPPAGATAVQVSPIKLADVIVATDTPTSKPTATDTPTSTLTPTHTPTPTRSFTPTPVPSPTRTHTPTPTHTATPRPTPTPYPVPSGDISRIDATFRSASLQLDRELIIYLPPGYNTQSQRRYPVWYVLHGWGGYDLMQKHTTEWEQWGLMAGVHDAIVKGAVQPMIVVQPNGFMQDGQCSLFFNHGPGTDGKPWGDYIWKDVVNYIDSNYRTIPRRESRAIGGFSFGGQGALSLALTHPEVFKVVGGHSPSFRGADNSISFMNDWNWFNQFDPIWLTQNTDHAKQLSLWLDVATGDDKVRTCGAGSDRCVEAYHTLLVDKGIPHEWHDTWPGPHEGTYWQGHLPDYLAWYSSQLIGQ